MCSCASLNYHCHLQREIADWIAPEGYDHAEAEANHLIYNADKNKVSWVNPVVEPLIKALS